MLNTMRRIILTCAQKLANSQLNLPHGTKQKNSNEETENKNRDAQKKRSSHKVHGVSPEAGIESMVGKIFVKKVVLSSAGSETGSSGW